MGRGGSFSRFDSAVATGLAFFVVQPVCAAGDCFENSILRGSVGTVHSVVREQVLVNDFVRGENLIE